MGNYAFPSMIGTKDLVELSQWCHNHLKPSIKKDAWTEEEELLLAYYHQRYGNRWAEIARYLPGRNLLTELTLGNTPGIIAYGSEPTLPPDSPKRPRRVGI